MTIGQVISSLNAKKGSPYRGTIWDHEVEFIDSKWEVESPAHCS
jgi:hypothetical protein